MFAVTYYLPNIYIIPLYMSIFIFIFLPRFLPSFTILPFLSFWGSWRLHLEDLGLTLVIFRQPQSIRCGWPYLPPIQDSFLILPFIILLSIYHPFLMRSIPYSVYYVNLRQVCLHTIYPNSVCSNLFIHSQCVHTLSIPTQYLNSLLL